MKGPNKEKGFTILELAITFAVGAVIIAPLGIILWQLSAVPADTSGALTAQTQVRNVDVNVSDDARSVQILVTQEKPVWAASAWTVRWTPKFGQVAKRESRS